MKPELKPCPFCGGAAKPFSYYKFSGVSCKDCGASLKVESLSERGAITAWNRRAQDTDKPSRGSQTSSHDPQQSLQTHIKM